MLVSFKIRNFLSFCEEQKFSMVAGKYRNFSDRVYRDGKYNLLRFMSIYGANASGKSNLVTAFGVFKSIIIGGVRNSSYPYCCKLNEKNKHKSSMFEITIDISGKIFVYGFEIIFSNNSISREWLFEELKNGTTHEVFSRDVIKGIVNFGTYIKSASNLDRLKIYGDDIKNDDTVLFLKLMNQNKDSLYNEAGRITVFKSLYNWIRFKLSVNSPEMPITSYSWIIDKNNLNEIAQKLNSFSTGIAAVSIDDVSPEKVTADIPKEMMKDVHEMLHEQTTQNDHNPAVLIRSSYNSFFIISIDKNGTYQYKSFNFKHNFSNSVFSLEEESDGTVRLLDIIEILLNEDNEKVYVVDEINRMFHPLLTIQFVKDFLEIAKNRNTQLIVTTHESQLMSLKLLRKDEICFINKDERGFSTIYSLTDYDDRFDKKIVLEYFKGKYKAIPFPMYDIT